MGSRRQIVRARTLDGLATVGVAVLEQVPVNKTRQWEFNEFMTNTVLPALRG